MFRKNTRHLQTHLFDFQDMLSPDLQQDIADSEEAHFFRLIYCAIDEEDFRCLFADTASRPNAPVNAMVAALFLRERKKWSFEQLFENIRFNLLTKIALGLRTLDEMPFSSATLFNFQGRLAGHLSNGGENLLERVFDRLTQSQLEILELKTTIQRTDSFQAASNIRAYTRLQLLVEVLIRLHRALQPEDRERCAGLFAPYVDKTSGEYVYRLTTADVDARLEQIGSVYRTLHEALAGRYRGQEAFEVFARVFGEHFIVTADGVAVRPPSEMRTDTVQSPDDLEATYRSKRGESYQGQVVNVVETAHPDNPIQLITDVAVAKNNCDDSAVLNGRIDRIKEKTPDWTQLHQDGGYGSEPNDLKLDKLGVLVVQTGSKGCPTKPVQVVIEELGENRYQATCAGQTVEATRTPTRWKAVFPDEGCAGCLLAEQCHLKRTDAGRAYYFDRDEYMRKRRIKNIEKIGERYRTLRANVEATVAEFKDRMRNGKLKVRGTFATMVFAISTAVAINFGRAYRMMTGKIRPSKARPCPA